MLNKGANIDLARARNPIVMADADKEDAVTVRSPATDRYS